MMQRMVQRLALSLLLLFANAAQSFVIETVSYTASAPTLSGVDGSCDLVNCEFLGWPRLVDLQYPQTAYIPQFNIAGNALLSVQLFVDLEHSSYLRSVNQYDTPTGYFGGWNAGLCAGFSADGLLVYCDARTFASGGSGGTVTVAASSEAIWAASTVDVLTVLSFAPGDPDFSRFLGSGDVPIYVGGSASGGAEASSPFKVPKVFWHNERTGDFAVVYSYCDSSDPQCRRLVPEPTALALLGLGLAGLAFTRCRKDWSRNCKQVFTNALV